MKTDTPIKISAVIPAYNSAAHIQRALDSVLTQTRPADEIIVVDDGSTDGTAEIVRSYGDKVRLIEQANSGASAARNAGILAATGDWIALLDADDEWLPEKLKMQTEFIERDTSIVWVTSNYDRCLCDQNIRKTHPAKKKAMKKLFNRCYYVDFFDAFLLDSYGNTDTMLIKKEAIVQAGLFFVGQKRANDMDMWWRIAFRWPNIGFINQTLAIYHLNVSGSISVSYNDRMLYSEMIDRNLEEAKKHEMLDKFKPVAVYVLRRWIRGWLFAGEKHSARSTLKHFSFLFSPGYRTAIRTLTVCPSLTANCCKLISKTIRPLGLNRPLTIRPK